MKFGYYEFTELATKYMQDEPLSKDEVDYLYYELLRLKDRELIDNTREIKEIFMYLMIWNGFEKENAIKVVKDLDANPKEYPEIEFVDSSKTILIKAIKIHYMLTQRLIFMNDLMQKMLKEKENITNMTQKGKVESKQMIEETQQQFIDAENEVEDVSETESEEVDEDANEELIKDLKSDK